MTRAVLLLNRAGRRREYGVSIRPDQTNRTNHYYQNHSQHHGVFRDVLAVIVCPKFKDKIGHGNSSEWIFSTAGKLMLGDEPDQAMGHRTTDFNPDWIGMIVLLISEPVKIAVVQERWRRAIEDVAMDLQSTDVSKQRAGSL